PHGRPAAIRTGRRGPWHLLGVYQAGAPPRCRRCAVCGAALRRRGSSEVDNAGFLSVHGRCGAATAVGTCFPLWPAVAGGRRVTEARAPAGTAPLQRNVGPRVFEDLTHRAAPALG